jgi:Membrane domain of glycerophosphoryl diester phosphodiesterase
LAGLTNFPFSASLTGMETSAQTSSEDNPQRCAYSGEIRPKRDMVQIGEHWIAVEHKDAYVQFLQQGGDLEGTRRPLETPSKPAFTALFSTAWKIYRAHFGIITAVYLTVWAPCNLLTSYAEAHGMLPESMAASIRLNSWIETFVGVIATGAVLHIARMALEGRKLTYREAISVGFRKWGAMMKGQLLVNFATVIGLLLLLIPGLMVAVRTVFVASFIVDKGENASSALDSSWQLSKGRFWALVGFGILIAVAAAFPFAILGFGAALVQDVIQESVENPLVLEHLWILDWLAETLGAIGLPLASIFFFVFYRVLQLEQAGKSAPFFPSSVPAVASLQKPIARPPQPPISLFPPTPDSDNVP